VEISNLISFCDSSRYNNTFGFTPTSSSFTNQQPGVADQKVQHNPSDKTRFKVGLISEQRRMIRYIGGIRPKRVEPLICSFTNKAAILIAFLTPDLHAVHRTKSSAFHKYKNKVDMRAFMSTWNCSNSTKHP